MKNVNPAVARGGKPLYGVKLGILMLDATFPRIVGEMGNALTWPFPVHYKIVRGATPDLVVRKKAAGLLDVFIESARELVRDGVAGITTNCGFLSLLQPELAAACAVPVATSSLMQYALIQSLLPPGKRTGIITISKASMTEKHLANAGIPLDVPIVGTENGTEFTSAILDSRDTLDTAAALKDLLDAADELTERHPEVGAILLECTNMPPYSSAISVHTGLPVFDITSFITWFHAGLKPRHFGIGHPSLTGE